MTLAVAAALLLLDRRGAPRAAAAAPADSAWRPEDPFKVKPRDDRPRRTDTRSCEAGLPYPSGWGEVLGRMHEPSLCTPRGGASVIRLTVMAAFLPELSVRIERRGARVELTAVTLPRVRHPVPDASVYLPASRVVQRSLSVADWDAVVERIAAIKVRSIDGATLDGRSWMLETQIGSRYRFFDRAVGPTPDDPFQAAGEALLHLANGDDALDGAVPDAGPLRGWLGP